MDKQTSVNKRAYRGLSRHAGSLPCARLCVHREGPLKTFVRGAANFLGRVGWVTNVADTHLRHVAVALRQRVELLVGSVDIRIRWRAETQHTTLSRSGVQRLKPCGELQSPYVGHNLGNPCAEKGMHTRSH